MFAWSGADVHTVQECEAPLRAAEDDERECDEDAHEYNTEQNEQRPPSGTGHARFPLIAHR